MQLSKLPLFSQDIMMEVTKREKQEAIVPDFNIDIYMKV